MQVCLSDDYELGFQQSVPFGGFFSCNTGNPLGVKKAADSAKGSNGMFSLSLIYLTLVGMFSLLFQDISYFNDGEEKLFNEII